MSVDGLVEWISMDVDNCAAQSRIYPYKVADYWWARYRWRGFLRRMRLAQHCSRLRLPTLRPSQFRLEATILPPVSTRYVMEWPMAAQCGFPMRHGDGASTVDTSHVSLTHKKPAARQRDRSQTRTSSKVAFFMWRIVKWIKAPVQKWAYANWSRSLKERSAKHSYELVAEMAWVNLTFDTGISSCRFAYVETWDCQRWFRYVDGFRSSSTMFFFLLAFYARWCDIKNRWRSNCAERMCWRSLSLSNALCTNFPLRYSQSTVDCAHTPARSYPVALHYFFYRRLRRRHPTDLPPCTCCFVPFPPHVFSGTVLVLAMRLHTSRPGCMHTHAWYLSFYFFSSTNVVVYFGSNVFHHLVIDTHSSGARQHGSALLTVRGHRGRFYALHNVSTGFSFYYSQF